jgi:hypothetical protein
VNEWYHFITKLFFMKLKFMSLLAMLTLLLSCGTTTTTTTTTSDNSAFAVPATISTTFTTQYPSATNVVWSAYNVSAAPMVDWDLVGWTPLDAGDYMVTYTMDGQNYYGWYDDAGSWVGSTYAITDYNTLPASINTMITNQYTGYTIEGVQREYWKDNTAYEIKLKKGDNDKVKLLVDANGNVLKQKK